jgi:alpha-beta hydrolase superfamily lysophospholipase
MRGAMEEASFVDAHGIEVFYRRWLHADPRGVVVIAHGASEHSGRYDRFARALTDAGFAAYALDHRGHGRTANATGPGRMGSPGGESVVDDLHELVGIARHEYSGVPVVAFGHSMGSMITLAYAVRHGRDLAGVVLCGFPVPLDDGGALAALFEGAAEAGLRDEPADVLAGFNAVFEPARTRFDWLSRDPAEVDAYVADPMCGDGMPLTYGYFVDLFGVLAPALQPGAMSQIGAPVFVIAGDQDPAAAMGANARALAAALEAAGLSVQSKNYPDARHELLNETNRDEVTADVIAWVSERVPTVGPPR